METCSPRKWLSFIDNENEEITKIDFNKFKENLLLSVVLFFYTKLLNQVLFLLNISLFISYYFSKKKKKNGCSPVNFLHILKTPFPKSTSGRLLLWCQMWKYQYGIRTETDTSLEIILNAFKCLTVSPVWLKFLLWQ